MNARLAVRKRMALVSAALAAIAVSALPGTATAAGGGKTHADHWGVITRNTIGSPVAALRKGPFGSFGVRGRSARPPYGQGSLGIEVADHSTTLTPPSEKAAFGNEVDFYGDSVLGLNNVGFHVFQTGENVTYGGGGTAGGTNMPGISLEIDPHLAEAPANHYSTMVWEPGASPVTNRWSRYLDATRSGRWYLTGNAGVVTRCNQTHTCSFRDLKAALSDGGAPPAILTVAVTKGRDHMWIGAVDGLRINRTVYDFEADGVRALRVR